MATTLNDFAVLYNRRGDHNQSIRLNQRVLAIREAALGPDDPGIAKALNNLARVHENKGEYETAGSLIRRAVSIWEKALGPDHPEVAFALDTADWRRTTLRRFILPSRRCCAAKGAGSTRRRHTCCAASSRQPGGIRIFGRLSAARSQLAAVTLRGPAGTRAAVYTSQLRRLDGRWTSSKPTSARGAPPSGRTPGRPRWKRCRPRCRRGRVIEFALYRPTGDATGSPAGTPHTCSRRKPARIGLTSARPWRSTALLTPGVRPCATLGAPMPVVSPVRWTPGSCSPCESHLGQSSHLLIAPDGALSLVPFAALVDEESEYLVEQLPSSHT